jgi:hypothetical protein
MVNKEEILAIKAEMKDIQNSINDLSKKHTLKAEELLNKVLSCKEVLTEKTWVLQGDRTLISRSSEHKMFSDFLQTDYHCHFENDDLFLNFDDWDISIHFKRSEGLTKFIERYSLTLSIKPLKDEASILKNQLLQLEKEIEKIENFNKIDPSKKETQDCT